jgi:hypothetical protein
VEQVPALEERAGAAGEQVTLELGAQARPCTKPMAAGATSNFQANSGALSCAPATCPPIEAPTSKNGLSGGVLPSSPRRRITPVR